MEYNIKAGLSMDRRIISGLIKWKESAHRKPLLLRGARQVGKTYTLRAFGEQCFDHVIYLNLENPSDADLFRHGTSFQSLWEVLPLYAKQKLVPGKTLLIIDEIQAVPSALNMLRFFYEEQPELHVACAGSLLEAMIEREGLEIPVGRVQYLYMFPMTFSEFLRAGHVALADHLAACTDLSTVSGSLHQECMRHFKYYLLIGGMPEVVKAYWDGTSVADLSPLYESLIIGFLDDIHKYASTADAKYLRLVLRHAPRFAGTRIKYENFADSGYRSRDMKRAFDLLVAANLINCASGCPSRGLPLTPNLRKSPKLIFLDTGLVNYVSDVRHEILQTEAVESLYKGRIAEQVVGQQLLALNEQRRQDVHYWYRDKPGSVAEVDFILQHQGQIFPIEVKAGKTGVLRSVQTYINETNAKHAFRIHSGPYDQAVLSTRSEKEFTLTSYPFYLLERMLAMPPEHEGA